MTSPLIFLISSNLVNVIDILAGSLVIFFFQCMQVQAMCIVDTIWDLIATRYGEVPSAWALFILIDFDHLDLSFKETVSGP